MWMFPNELQNFVYFQTSSWMKVTPVGASCAYKYVFFFFWTNDSGNGQMWLFPLEFTGTNGLEQTQTIKLPLPCVTAEMGFLAEHRRYWFDCRSDSWRSLCSCHTRCGSLSKSWWGRKHYHLRETFISWEGTLRLLLWLLELYYTSAPPWGKLCQRLWDRRMLVMIGFMYLYTVCLTVHWWRRAFSFN